MQISVLICNHSSKNESEIVFTFPLLFVVHTFWNDFWHRKNFPLVSPQKVFSLPIHISTRLELKNKFHITCWLFIVNERWEVVGRRLWRKDHSLSFDISQLYFSFCFIHIFLSLPQKIFNHISAFLLCDDKERGWWEMSPVSLKNE